MGITYLSEHSPECSELNEAIGHLNTVCNQMQCSLAMLTSKKVQLECILKERLLEEKAK